MNLERRLKQVNALSEFWTSQSEAGHTRNAACIREALLKSIDLSEQCHKEEIKGVGL